MKKLITMLALSLGVFFTLLFPVKAASAGGYGYGYSGGYYGGGYGHSKHHRYDNRYYGQPANYNQRYRSSRNYTTYPAQSGSYQGRPCQQVSKYTYDAYGNARKIAGTMCYNNGGEGYIVEGSRYEIR